MDMLMCICNPSYVVVVNSRITVQASLGKNMRSYLKNNQFRI
jgi:hypothetical protein